jgi:hypothetical protein
MQNISIFHGKIARYDVLIIMFINNIDISHHRYKLCREKAAEADILHEILS